MNAASPRKLTSWWNCQKLIASVVLLASCHWAVAQPLINTQPANTTVSLGATAQFRVLATSTNPPITYQWWFKEAALDAVANPSAAKNLLSLTNVTLADAGPYFVVVSDTSGLAATSQVATLTVDPTFVKITGPGFLANGSDWTVSYWVDYDNDGWLEVVVPRGGDVPPPRPMEVYKNNRDDTFTRITNGLAQMAGRWEGLAWADYDGDGRLDCIAAQFQPMDPVLFLNQGNGEFAKIVINQNTTANRKTAPGYVVTCADYDGDGWVDVAIGCNMGYSYGTNTLLHNLGGGRFEVVTNTPVAVRGAYVENFAWIDYDGDGHLDLYANTSATPSPSSGEQDLLFQNQGNGTFVRITNHPLVNTAGVDLVAGWADYDNDGDMDVFVPYWQLGTSALYRNLGNGQFEVDPNGPVLDVNNNPVSASWGDYDNDGYLDLFVTQFAGRNRLFHNDGNGTFTEILTGSPVNGNKSRNFYGAWIDYNNDGFLDLVVYMFKGTTPPHELYRNNLPQQGNTNHWLKVQLRGVASSTEGTGAKVRVKATIRGQTVWQMRQIGSLTTFATELLAHFGLGDATNVDVVWIEWPSSLVQELHDVPANQSLTITEHQAGVTNAPSLTASRLASDTVQLTLTGQTNLLYVLQASTNLVQWTKIAVRTNLTGSVDFTGSASTNYPQRFYRAVAP